MFPASVCHLSESTVLPETKERIDNLLKAELHAWERTFLERLLQERAVTTLSNTELNYIDSIGKRHCPDQ